MPPKPQNLLSYIVYYLSLITGGIQHVREEREVRAPYFWEAIVSFLSLIIVMSIGIVVFEVDPHIPMFIGVIIAALMSLRLGYKWAAIEEMMITGISRAMQAVLILATCGMYIAATLGVSVSTYLPWAVFNYTMPIVTLVMAFMGITLTKMTPEEQAKADAGELV